MLVNAVNPPYTQWPELWPPMATAFLSAAEHSGAGLLIVGNLYGYGPVTAPMTESLPMAPAGIKGGVRATMWRDALEADQEGRLRTVELRASDYFGPGATTGMSYLNQYAIAPAVRGRTARHVRGDVDAPHSWTYLADIARLAVAVAETDRTGVDWGRAWHVPTSAPVTMREVAAQVAEIAGVAAHEPRLYPWLLRKALARRAADPRARRDDVPVRPAVHPRLLGGAAAVRARTDPLARRARRDRALDEDPGLTRTRDRPLSLSKGHPH